MGVQKLVPNIIPGNWTSVRQVVAKLASKLGPVSEPTFASLTLSDLTASRLTATDASKVLVSSDLASWVTGTANEINVADDGDGTITIGIVDPLIVGKGGTGLATITDHGVLVGSGTDAVTALAAAGSGALIIGSTGADPVIAALTGTANQVVVTNAAGSITLSTPQDIATGSTPTFSRVFLADGAVGTPSLSFTSDTDTGLYRSGSGSGETLNFGVSGTNQFYIQPGKTGLKDSLSAYYGMFAFGGTAMTTDRQLTLDLNNATRILDLTGNATLNQDVSTAGSPDFASGVTSGTLTIGSGSITDSSGNISFVNENLVTTGSFGCNTLNVTLTGAIGTLNLGSGSITDGSGAINFGNENLTTTGIVTGEQITSTDDITMAGLFTNTPAVGDATVININGDTNARAYAGAAETPISFSRTLTGTGTAMNSMGMVVSALTYDYDFTGQAGAEDIIRCGFDSVVYTGEITPSSVFIGNGRIAVRGTQCYVDFDPPTVTDPSTGNLHFKIAGGYFEVLNRADYSLDGSGTCTTHTYGGYFYAREAVIITAGTPVLNYYGGYFEAAGSADGTSTSYGGYFVATGSDTNYGIYVAAGQVILAGTARVIKKIEIISVSLSPGSTGPDPVILGDYIGYSYDIGDDSVAGFEIPYDWDTSTALSVKIYWYINEAFVTNNGETAWTIDWSACPTDATETVDAPTHTGTINFSDQIVPVNAKELTKTAAGTIAAASLSEGDLVGFTITRVAAGGPAPTADPVIVRIEIEYTSNRLGEAT